MSVRWHEIGNIRAGKHDRSVKIHLARSIVRALINIIQFNSISFDTEAFHFRRSLSAVLCYGDQAEI